MRAAGVGSVLIYCIDYACWHHITVPDDADRGPDELRISDVEDRSSAPSAASVAPNIGPGPGRALSG